MRLLTDTAKDPRRAYSFDRGAYDRARDSRKAIGLGLGLGLGLSSAPGAGGAAVVRFYSFFTGVIQSIQSDLGITTISGGVSQWDDQVGTNHYTQATAGTRPTVGVGPNSFPEIIFDGVDDFLNCALDLPAPGTTPTFVWAVYRIISAPAGNAPIVGGDRTTGCFVYSPAGSKSTNQYNGTVTNSNSGSAGSNYVRGEFLFSNSASDYSKAGSTVVLSGTPAGNQDPGASRNLGGGSGNTALNVGLLALVHLNNAPSTGQKAAADAAVTAKYGASVNV
jgi:hypothetical protein